MNKLLHNKALQPIRRRDRLLSAELCRYVSWEIMNDKRTKNRHPLIKNRKNVNGHRYWCSARQIIVALACNNELEMPFSADHVLFPVKDKSIPRVLLSRAQPVD
ncbi:MAG: hypothetical protein KJO91_07565 [Gammaproteobacteria bacterium]|nr:hypothetical protein [Gammaproteobacteria bacterium]